MVKGMQYLGYWELLHLPDTHVAFFAILGTALRIPPIMHHFNFPTCRESLRDDLCGPFQVQSLQVPNCEE